MNWLMLNSSLLALLAIISMAGLFHFRRTIGIPWIVASFEMLLLIFLVHRLDEIVGTFGLQIIDETINLLSPWLIFSTLLFGFLKMYQRRKDLQIIETQRQARQARLREKEAQLERLRKAHEIGGNWDRPIRRIG